MSVIYLRHPIHGNKIAMCDQEAEEDAKNGWMRYDVGTLLTPVNAAPVQVYVEDINELRKLWAEKHGTMPHHRKTSETLRKEL